MKVLGILLIIAGVAALAYGGFSYTTKKKDVDLGPLQVSHKQEHTVPLPPLLGVAAIIGGGALVYFGVRKG
jgi:uncharacterized membrane protein HdeD (DUF308 family)